MTNLRHQCDRNGCYREQLWDWTPFNDCFGDSGIRISDIDGMVERNGLFLMLDGKNVGPDGGCFISAGQRRMYEQFAYKGGHVIVFWGHPPASVLWMRQWLPGGQLKDKQEIDLDGLRAVVSAWYLWANGMQGEVA